MKPALVILAAGASRRLGECKALAMLGSKSALEHLLEAAACFDELAPLVVTGRHHDTIEPRLAPGVEACFNADWQSGRTGSVAAAVRARSGRDLCLAPVDTPLVQSATFAGLLQKWEANGAPPRGWLAPCVELSPGRKFGHPLILGRELAARLLSEPADRPLYELRGVATPLLGLMVEDIAVLDDLDEPGDLERLRSRISAG